MVSSQGNLATAAAEELLANYWERNIPWNILERGFTS